MVSILSQEISGRQIKDSIISPPPTDLSKIWSALDQEKFERQEEDKSLRCSTTNTGRCQYLVGFADGNLGATG